MTNTAKNHVPSSINKPINLDDTVYNADWPKRTWDLPEPGSKEFKEFLRGLGITEEKLKQMPVYQHRIAEKTGGGNGRRQINCGKEGKNGVEEEERS